MIKFYKNSDVTEQKGLIVHQVNCQGVMGSGVAKALRNKYPIIFTPYQIKCKNTSSSSNLLGDIQTLRVEDNVYICNMFTQDRYGRKGLFTNYKAMEIAIRKIYKFCVYNNITNVNIPYLIGCGLGGGDWNKVLEIWTNVFEDSKLTFKYGINLNIHEL